VTNAKKTSLLQSLIDLPWCAPLFGPVASAPRPSITGRI
jgi:hypothetical protein